MPAAQQEWLAPVVGHRVGGDASDPIERLQAPRYWVASLLLHGVLLALFGMVYVEAAKPVQRVQVLSEIPEVQPQEDFLELNDFNVEVAPDAPVSLTPGTNEVVANSLESLKGPQDDKLSTFDHAAERELIRPLANRLLASLSLSDNLTGTRGHIVAAGGGDEGSVDRITVEILRQLEKGKVLVAWLFDASGSLAMRRENVIKRVNRVYHELKVLDKHHEAALLTGVVAFGKQTVFMTKEASANPKEILKAVQNIKTDDSGTENVFEAVRATTMKWRSGARDKHRLMIVILTDEIGDDGTPARLDETVKLVQRYRTPVYVIGPLAPFGRRQLIVEWTDGPTGETFRVPIDRGPETVEPECPRLPAWYKGTDYGLIQSGFGPYALTRLARDSSGLYFAHDDGSIPGPQFDPYVMLQYTPNYGTAIEYKKEVSRSPMRSAIVEIARNSNGVPEPEYRFLAAGIQFNIRALQGDLPRLFMFIDRAIETLRGVRKERDKETSNRWRAHYDLLMGRLLAAKIRAFNYAAALNDMYGSPKAPKDGTKNAFELAGDESNMLPGAKAADSEDGEAQAEGESDQAKEEKKPEKPKKPRGRRGKQSAAAKNDREEAAQYLQKVIREHPDTPWAALAAAELEFPLAFVWQETFMMPPKGEPLPWDKKPWEELSKEQKEAKKNFEKKQKEKKQRDTKRAEAKKRIPKL